MAKTTAVQKQSSSKTPGQAERAQPAGLVSAVGLDRLIHERMRLAIVVELAARPSISFSELKRHLRTTDGNLSVHARRLEEAGYITCRKSGDRRAPRTEYSLTPAGRAALNRYLDRMEALIAALRVR